MNLEHLQAFYETVKYNSISKAAESLHLTQPGLSMQLKNLEKEFGARLLTRSNKGVELTEEGKVVFNYADTILSIKGNIERDLKNLQKDTPKLMVTSCKSVGEYALPCSIYTFKKLHKEVDIDMKVVNSTEVIQNLHDHTINIGIIQDEPLSDDIDIKKIISDELILVGKSYNAKKTISIEELKKLPLILREKTSNTRYLVDAALKKKGVSIKDLNVIYDLNSPEAIKSSISAGNGFSFLPRLILRKELKQGIIQSIEVEGIKINFNYNIAYRKNYTFTEYEQKFVDFITSNKKGFC
ncbi:LysR family transcriptional regulator [Clostridium sp. BSD9I1]|uniref:LysR family transcriptional regulator n=1 Tax=Clostridium sp. BSD9I1 TaxID=2003589 RepID=UPI00164591E6|nr:LysR family transcriptional regulator [Clostridium sp. BSD9I1]